MAPGSGASRVMVSGSNPAVPWAAAIGAVLVLGASEVLTELTYLIVPITHNKRTGATATQSFVRF